jgi:hypothetical protein
MQERRVHAAEMLHAPSLSENWKGKEEDSTPT